jgi:hypothetical protein
MPARSPHSPGAQGHARAERVGTALKGLATELIEERRKVALLRSEVTMLRAQLAAVTPAQRDEDARNISVHR